MSAPGVQTSGHHSWCKIVDVYVTQLSLSTGYACNLKLCDAIFSGVWFFILQWQSIIVMKCPGMTYVLPVSNIVWSATCGIVLCTVAVQVKLAANVEQHTVFSVLAYLRLKHDGSILLFSSAIPHYVSLSVHCRLGIVENSQVPHVETSVVQSTFVCLNLSRFKTADFFITVLHCLIIKTSYVVHCSFALKMKLSTHIQEVETWLVLLNCFKQLHTYIHQVFWNKLSVPKGFANGKT